MRKEAIVIDGDFGEGGGQVLRTSLALSMVASQPFRIRRIRAGRKRKGLLRQHLTAVNAAAKVCGACVEGAEMGASELLFVPKQVQPGEYRFVVGTAGSTTLVLQTLLPALITAAGPSTIVLEGGTHNPYAPPFDFLKESFLTVLRRMGVMVKVSIERYGFYPAGGGKIKVMITPERTMKVLDILDKGNLLVKQAKAMSALLPDKIGKQEMQLVSKLLGWPLSDCQAMAVNSVGPGNIVMLELMYEKVTEVITAFGEKGVSLKKVVDDVVHKYKAYLKADVPVGPYLADQLLIPMALAKKGSFLTMKPTLHTETNVEIIKQFLDIDIDIAFLGDDKYMICIGGEQK